VRNPAQLDYAPTECVEDEHNLLFLVLKNQSESGVKFRRGCWVRCRPVIAAVGDQRVTCVDEARFAADIERLGHPFRQVARINNEFDAWRVPDQVGIPHAPKRDAAASLLVMEPDGVTGQADCQSEHGSDGDQAAFHDGIFSCWPVKSILPSTDAWGWLCFEEQITVADPFDPYREALVMETKTIWPAEFADLDEKKRDLVEKALHADPKNCAGLEYVRVHSGFCRQITVTPQDLERAG